MDRHRSYDSSQRVGRDGGRDYRRERDDRDDSYNDPKRRKYDNGTHMSATYRAPVDPSTEINVLDPSDNTKTISLRERSERLHQSMVQLAKGNIALEEDRGRSFDRLRRNFRDLCQRKLGIEDPKECFNRFIMERHMLYPYGKEGGAAACDPLIPFSTEPLPPPSLFREIMEDVPCKLPWPRNAFQVFQNIVTFADTARKFLSRSPNQDAFADIYARLDEAKKWSFQNRDAKVPQEKAQEYLDMLKKECEPHLAPIATPIVTEICDQITSEANAAAQALVSSRTQTIDSPPPVRPIVRQSSQVPSSVSVEKGSDYFRLHVTVHDKLRHLFELARGSKLSSSKDEEDFHSALWALHYRYRTLLGGLRKFEGSGLQAAVPPSTFDVLTKLFAVSMECFASPFNCNFSNFCSVFDDVDVLFNSSGSFFKFHPVEGSFEVNPPFCEELMEKMNSHLETLLAASDKPLSFIIFLPHWMTPPSVPIEYLKTSKFRRAHFIVDANEHKYYSGFQQSTGEATRSFTPVHSSIVFFLQNDAGFEKWQPTDDKIAEVKRAFLPPQ